MRNVENAVGVVDLRSEAARHEFLARGARRHGRVVVVVVHRPTDAVVGVEVRFADLVVLHLAVCVAESTAPTVREPFAHLDDAGVVAVDAFAHLEHADVPELRERTQQLPARGVRLSAKSRPCKCRVAEKRIRHGLVQHSGSEGCQVLRIELIDVHGSVNRSAERQVIAARADVAHRHRHVASQLPLQVD